MQPRFTVPALLTALIVSVSLGIGADAIKAPPAPPPVSSFAPAEDLRKQIDYYIGHIEEALANKSEFDDAAKTRIKKDANTLIALALTLGLHDSENRLQSAGGVIAISIELALANDYDATKARLAEIKKLYQGEIAGPPPTALRWEKVASLEQLMKQVPVVNSALKRAVTPQRFKQMRQQSAGQSATLAAIAQAVMADTSAVKNPADLEKWYECCAEMRSAAGAANVAIHAGDEAATTAAMSRLAASCETCHKVFRKE